jgi:prepilin-type processing-associated H-X9-DG protein
MKQQGLALHNFVDARKKMPPITIQAFGYPAFTFLLPYMEQQAFYDKLHPMYWNGAEGDKVVWNTLGRNLTQFACPTRPIRDSGQVLDTDTPARAYDYGLLVYRATATSWTQFKAWDTTSAALDDMKQALRPAVISNNTWACRDGLQRVVDGLSKTAVFAEKHVMASTVGQCCSQAANPAKTDGFVFFVGPFGDRDLMATLPVNDRGIALGPGDQFSNYAISGPTVGSWHPGGCNILMLDGAVKGVSPSISTATLNSLVHCSDGAAVNMDP